MSREWNPGNVSIVRDEHGTERIAVSGALNPRMKHYWHYDEMGIGRILSDHRPLVVIDPEDREQVERFREIASRWADDVPYDEGPGDLNYTTAMQAALREFANPKPEVFRHYIGSSNGGLKTALCGKVWRLNAEANVTVMGYCETCADLVDSGWSA